MKKTSMDDSVTGELPTPIEDLRGQLALLAERVAHLEASRVVVPSPGVPTAPRADALSKELLVVISAAVAAFLGEHAHLRQVRLISTNLWAQQGRASVQASHRLNR